MDRQAGRQCNANMEFYKLGGIEDMPQIVVEMVDMPARRHRHRRAADDLGCAAIEQRHLQRGSACVPTTPFYPDKVLAALAKG